jgi:methyltransferase
MFFCILLAILIFQRIAELLIAKSNEKWMKKRGAKEYGRDHYLYIVWMHIGFFISLIGEVLLAGRPLSPYWPLLLMLFLIVQIGRIWVMMSMGRFWNTKIIVLPGAKVIRKGPFKYMKHPNYAIVTLELLIIPLLFQAYATAIVFFILNQALLKARIPIEEKALKENTDF